MKVDYAEWVKSFDGNIKIVINTDMKILHEACEILFARIMHDTPIGNPHLWKPPYWPKNYTPGTLKAAWRIEHHQDSVVIHNDEPYAYRVETGWSGQAPQGMLRINLKNFNAILDAVARKYNK